MENGELNYSNIITALQIIPYSRKQYFIPLKSYKNDLMAGQVPKSSH